MWRYVLKRLLLMIPVILGVTVVIFSIMYFVPGDPASMVLGANATPEELAAKRTQLGLDAPYMTRLLLYIKDVFLRFDFGNSYLNSRSISDEIFTRFPITLAISVASIALAMLVGVPLGINAAVHRGGAWDTVSMILALLGVSMPTFWVALLLIMLFSLRLNWLPPLGFASFKYYIMPCIANCFHGLALMARQMRSSMLEVIHSDYVTTARAKGQSSGRVLFGHALPNALIPVVTIAGTTFGKMLGGTVVIEAVFSMPGIGGYMIGGINGRDYPVVQGCVIFLAIMFSLMMLLVDLLYAAIDPRIKAQYSQGRKGAR